MLFRVSKLLVNTDHFTNNSQIQIEENCPQVRTATMSASLIGRSGSSTFRLSIAAVSMSPTGSRFSSESAPRPFQYGIRGRGGTIFSNRPFGVKHFQTIHGCGVNVAHGLALLFGIGTKALPVWDSRTRWNNLCGGLIVRLAIGPSGHTNFSNRPFGVKHFQTIHRCGVNVAHGLALLFGIGSKALPVWDSRTRWNNLCGGLIVRLAIGPSGHTNSPHPSSREGHPSTASLIGRSGSSTFRLSIAAVSMAPTGSRFSSESAPRPFQYGIRGRG